MGFWGAYEYRPSAPPPSVAAMTLRRAPLLAAAAPLLARAAIPEHLVHSLPTFPTPIPFRMYSGYLEVDGPFVENPYDKIRVRYELHMSQSGNASDPLVSVSSPLAHASLCRAL